MRAFAAASRKAGRDPVGAGPPADELARLALLLLACERWHDEAPSIVAELYRTGDLREKLAVVRALSDLPEPQRFVAVAEHAVRADAFAVFQAIALDNPFAARHLGAVSFHQLVMKAAMNGLPLARIAELGSRRSPELARMARAFESERRAAGRPVPSDLDLVTRENER